MGGEIIKEIFLGFSDTIKGMSGGIKDAFMNIIYEDPTATTKVLSDFAKFGFVIMGFGLAGSLVFLGIRKICGR